MIEVEIPDIKCLIENHTQFIQQVCLNKQCTDLRLICNQCLKKGLHQQHMKDVQGLNQLVNFIDNNNKQCDSLCESISKQGDLVLDSYLKLKNEIKNKYHISKERLLKIDSNQLNQAIGQMISLADYKISISKIITDLSNEYKLKIDKLKQELLIKTVNFSEVSKDDEKSSTNLFNKGFALFNNQKFDDAIQVIDQTLKLNPNNRDSLWCKGECLIMKNNLKEALNFYNQAISVDSKHLNSLSSKGDCLRGLGQFNEAIILYDQALSINPKHLDSLYGKGDCLRELGKYDESLKWLNQALQIQPKDYFSLQSKGVCLQEKQNFVEALNCFEQALKISPVDQFIKMRKNKCEQALKKS
ncbi:unnamed protein product (macronuclear) [Paramecium tetraurelia]|uniref:Uncharacterized protein n=1 Tax=Paramecium tetraurelia TaxID=5888 RepID=A0BW32_PARTE|nr:uncharacterized protein GSPATT00032601001 [Paramecium tetraurelia]CAK62749.1 unnamed protein product [Paramecium tetraurelia]|eukprot:XP_001430147.1 hypothetical protein (macronuclear) [Paramecium tetraurelia strain d4-2]